MLSILYISGGTYSLKSTLNDRFFEKLFYSQSFCQKSVERKLYFVLMSGLVLEPGLYVLIGQHTTY